ncbi:mycofactocin biosynthesis glycosyltransferase MftF [Williamsia deligens]|uniref:Mycofactocin biosynthesis glycosyltransferase MftF n=1 Tax=Williamsia deligens TaxID=321325 RepID=A0ABW3G1I0_9NOCA|nr:mycofactocin biosynthesis glycosyltransferase MftF [Williamsia deligens]MCP2194697.1 mycofactocin system glycosyltransferase [Williamsia deligens]
MTAPADVRLPDGFQVQIDPRVSVSSDGRHLIGGSPTRLLSLSDRAASMVDGDGRLVVSDEASATVARRLLDAGVAHPRPMFGPSVDDVTVVIPVRDNQSGIDRLLRVLDPARTIVVDDGSRTPVVAPGARIIRHEVCRGPAAARNTGAAAAATDFVAFVDSDVVPESSWLFTLLAHFSDPRVAMVAPRVVAMTPAGGATARYQALCSSLDMGRREGPVVPGSRLPYVPSAAIILRRTAFDGFDERLHVAEDVDLSWRLHAAGWTVRYDPIATVAHDHRTALGAALGRRRFYGTGAALLSDRHPGVAAPLVMTVPTALAALAALTRSRWGAGVILAMIAVVASRLYRRVEAVPDAATVAARLTAEAVGFGFLQFAAALCRHYWPVSALLALISTRFRSVLLAVALVDGVAEWVRAEVVNPDPVEPLGVARFVIFHRLDDLAYGAGLWQGVVTARTAAALRPTIVRARGSGSHRPAPVPAAGR